LSVASALTLAVLALALATQPWSVLAAILLVASHRGVVKEVAYVVGWVLALTVVAIATVVLYPAKPKVASTSAVLAWIELAAGLVLVGWVLLRWRRPTPSTGSTGSSGSTEPRWMGRVDTMRPLTAGALGAFLPNYVFVVAAVTNVLEIGLTRGAAATVMVAWVLVASLGVAAPLLVLLVRRDAAAMVFQGWRAWLLTHAQAVLLAVLGVVGVALAVKGLVGLVD
jgi:hypothetical protein